jgi:hypothetical protein
MHALLHVEDSKCSCLRPIEDCACPENMFLKESAESSYTALLYLHVFTFFVGKEDGLGTYKP